VVEAVNHHLKVRSCLIDGEVVCCDEQGLATFQLLRRRRSEPQAFLYAFDLLELNGDDLRKIPRVSNPVGANLTVNRVAHRRANAPRAPPQGNGVARAP
jgi:hypothetical protein